MADWELVIKISGGSYKALKMAARSCSEAIERTKNFKELGWVNLGSGSEGDETGYSYRCNVKSPIEAQIIALRQEADELEKSLREPAAS